jgi:hypothetical protein
MKQQFSFLLLASAIGLHTVTVYAQDKTGEIDKLFSWATEAGPGWQLHCWY